MKYQCFLVTPPPLRARRATDCALHQQRIGALHQQRMVQKHHPFRPIKCIRTYKTAKEAARRPFGPEGPQYMPETARQRDSETARQRDSEGFQTEKCPEGGHILRGHILHLCYVFRPFGERSKTLYITSR